MIQPASRKSFKHQLHPEPSNRNPLYPHPTLHPFIHLEEIWVSSYIWLWRLVGRENSNKEPQGLAPCGKEIRRSWLLLWTPWGRVPFACYCCASKSQITISKSWPSEVVIIIPDLWMSNWPSDNCLLTKFTQLANGRTNIAKAYFQDNSPKWVIRKGVTEIGTGTRVKWPRNRGGSHCLQWGFNFCWAGRASEQTWWMPAILVKSQ